MSLASNGDSLLYRGDSFPVAAKIGLENGKIKESILIEGTISVLHCVIKVAMEVIEGR